ncbi:hypothetical protein BaRGS_00031940, partial [Batillaria attramentaria]
PLYIMKLATLVGLWMVLTTAREMTVLAGSLVHCNVPSVMAGQATSLTCYFNHDLKQENTDLVVQHSDLQEQLSEYSTPSPTAYVTTTEQENITTYNEQKGNNTNVIAIIIPIVLILVLICAAFVIFKCRSRRVRKDKTEIQSKRSGPICDDSDTAELHSLVSHATRHDASTKEETTMTSGGPRKKISGTHCEYIYNRTRQFVEETGAVVITGPEQCGKSTLGRAVMNHFAEKGLHPLELDHPNQWREKKQDGKKYVVLLDECPMERSSMKDLNSMHVDQSYVIFITRSGVSNGEISKRSLPPFLKTAPVVTLSNRKTSDEETSKKLLQACKENDVEQVTTLLSDGVDPNCVEKTVTHENSQHASGSKQHVDEIAGTPLHVACEAGNFSVVDNLLMVGGNVNTKDRKGFVPLHVASKFNHRDVTEILLEAKSDVNAQDNNGLTPLHVACVHKAKDSAQVLLSANANFEATTGSGWTPLHMACFAGSKEIVELLLDKGAVTNAVNKEGQTPLHMACFAGSKEIVELLLDKNADTNAENKE